MRTRSSFVGRSVVAAAILALTPIGPLIAEDRDVRDEDRGIARVVEPAGSPGAVMTVEFEPDGYVVPTEVDAHVKLTNNGKPVPAANLELVLWKGPHSPFKTRGKTGSDGTAILTIPGDGNLGTDSGWVWIPESAEDTWNPGQARPQISWDFILLWADLYVDLTGDWWGATFCLWMLGYWDVSDAGQQADSLRQYRDEVLGSSDRGRLYTQQYYEHSAEVAHLALTHPDIGYALTEALVRYGPLIEQLGASGHAEITDQDLSDVTGIIDSIRPYASEQLETSLMQLREDLASDRAQQELGFVIRERR
ncbi:MAG: hypothetical protein AB1714_03770 [Acidobacteriota bacterium]